jgi:hypothetical protein
VDRWRGWAYTVEGLQVKWRRRWGGERAPIASWGGMRRSEEARVSEEAVRRKGGGGGPRNGGWAKDGEAEEPV